MGLRLPVLHKPPSISKSALLLSPCSSWADPESRWFDEDTRDKEDLVKRDDGIRFHHGIDFYNNESRSLGYAADDVVGVYMTHAIKYLTQVIGPKADTIQSEVAIAVNWTTGHAVILQGVKNRNYPDMPGYQFGTADLVVILKDGSLLIADWKTGGSDGAKEQLLSLAVAFQKVMLDQNLPRTIRISCLSVNEEGVWPNEREVTQQEIDTHADAMRFRWEDIGKGKGIYEPGIHCTTLYCPHLAYCSSIGTAVEESAKSDTEGDGSSSPLPAFDAWYRYTDEPTSDREAGHAMSLISAARRQMKYTEAKLKEYIKHGGNVVSGNMKWELGTNGYRWRKS